MMDFNQDLEGLVWTGEKILPAYGSAVEGKFPIPYSEEYNSFLAKHMRFVKGSDYYSALEAAHEKSRKAGGFVLSAADLCHARKELNEIIINPDFFDNLK